MRQDSFSEYVDFTLPVSFLHCSTLIPLSLNRFPEHREIQARSDKANAHKVASFLCAVDIGNALVCVLYLKSVRVMFYREQGVFICSKLASMFHRRKKCSWMLFLNRMSKILCKKRKYRGVEGVLFTGSAMDKIRYEKL